MSGRSSYLSLNYKATIPRCRVVFISLISRRVQCSLLNRFFFCYCFDQPPLHTKASSLNPWTVTFHPSSYYSTQPSIVQTFFSGGTTFYVGNPNAVVAATYSKPLMAPYKNDWKTLGQSRVLTVNQSLIKI